MAFSMAVVRHAVLRSFLDDEIQSVERRHDESSVLFRQADTFVVDEAAVFDGSDACANSIVHSIRRMGVGCDLGPEHACGFDDRFELFEAVSLLGQGIPSRQHATRGGDLDEIGAVLNLGAHGPAELVNSVGDLRVAGEVQIGIPTVDIGVAAGATRFPGRGINAGPGTTPSLMRSRRAASW